MRTTGLTAGTAAAIAAGFLATAIAAPPKTPGISEDAPTRTVEFKDGDGKRIGTATLTETPNGVLISADVEGLEPGWHAFHIHESAKCDAPDFKAAGGHYHPHGDKHGFQVAGGPHAGDLQNVHVDKDGRLKVQSMAANLTLDGDKAPLLDSDGSALMIHAGADDYESQPSGAAGKRIACAEIGGGRQAK